MRRFGFSMALLVLLAGCGGGENTIAKEDASQAAVSVKESSDELDTSGWLQVEARGDGEAFTWHLAGADEGVTVDEVGQALDEYATKVDEGAKLPGPNQDGISANPVLFKAGPGVSSRAFLALIELMASRKLWRMYAELDDGKSFRKQDWVELPRDEGLSRDGPGKVRAYLRILRDGGNLRYRIGPGPSQTEAIPGAEAKLAKLNDEFDGAIYMKVRDAIRDKVASIRSPEGDRLDAVEILAGDAFASSDKFANWGEVFVAIDALRRVNDARESTPLATTFRFMDALGKYRDD